MIFSLFSLKFPEGDKAMGGLADAAVATFLVEAIFKYICGDFAGIAFLGEVGAASGGMGAVACFGGSFTNGMIFKRLQLGDNGRVIAVMLEPLTQADIITKNPLPIYASNFFGGAISGIAAAVLGIVNNAPGTASPHSRFAGTLCVQ